MQKAKAEKYNMCVNLHEMNHHALQVQLGFFPYIPNYSLPFLSQFRITQDSADYSGAVNRRIAVHSPNYKRNLGLDFRNEPNVIDNNS